MTNLIGRTVLIRYPDGTQTTATIPAYDEQTNTITVAQRVFDGNVLELYRWGEEGFRKIQTTPTSRPLAEHRPSPSEDTTGGSRA